MTENVIYHIFMIKKRNMSFLNSYTEVGQA